MTSFNVTTPNLIIKDINVNDFQNLRTVYNDKAILKYLSKPIFSDDEINIRLKDMLHYRLLNLQLSSGIIDIKSYKFIGFIRVDFYPSMDYLIKNGTVINGKIINELSPGGHFQSAYLISEYQNKGYMTEVISLLKKHLSKNNIEYLFGTIHKENIAVKKLLDKFDFKYYDTSMNLNPLGIPIRTTKSDTERFVIGRTL